MLFVFSLRLQKLPELGLGFVPQALVDVLLRRMLAQINLLGLVAKAAGKGFLGLPLVEAGGVVLLGADHGVLRANGQGVLGVADALLGVLGVIPELLAVLEFPVQVFLSGLLQRGGQLPKLFQLVRAKHGLEVPLVIRQLLERGNVGKLDPLGELAAVFGVGCRGGVVVDRLDRAEQRLVLRGALQRFFSSS